MRQATGVDVVPLTGVIGAEVRGIDLRQPLASSDRDAIKEALVRHLVVFFRDQPLTGDEQLAFASNFGEPCTTTPDPDEDGPVFSIFEDTADSRPNADHWHTDLSFARRTPNYAVLQMVIAPDVGGDTMWVSTAAAYQGLSPAMRAIVGRLDAEHGLGPAAPYLVRKRGAEYADRMREVFHPAHHPLVRIHPETGMPALYLAGSFMDGIVGMKPEESDLLLGFLHRRLDDPNIQCRWRWRLHDIAMWDERCTAHRALSDHYPAHRAVRRVLVGDDVPVPVAREGRSATLRQNGDLVAIPAQSSDLRG